MTRSVLIPPNSFLRFNHAFDFDPGYDGGIVQYTADEGVTWNDLTVSEGNVPVGVLPYRFGNPLQGHLAFTDMSAGYRISQASLSAFQGQRLRFRFRIGTDSTVGDLGWFIDDVEIYHCEQVPDVTADAAPVPEGEPGTVPAVFTVRLSKPFPLPLTMSYETLNLPGLAKAGEDYVPVSGKLFFPPGTTSGTVSVPVIGDRDREADELFELRVSHLPPYYVWGGGTGTIVDDDVANLGLTISDVALAEPRAGVANATFTVTLSPPGNGVSTTVAFHTVDGTAVAPTDYVATSGTLTFPPYDGSGSLLARLPVTVPVKASSATASPRSFYLDLSDSSDPPIARSRGTATIYKPGF